MFKQKKYLFWLLAGLLLIILLVVILFTEKSSYVEFNDKRAIRGNQEASIRIVEWSDFQCPACGAAFPLVEEVVDKYADKLKFEYRHFPLTYHRQAYLAAVASECANDQGKFWEYYRKLFINQDNLSKNSLRLYAEEINLDSELFNDCLNADIKKKVVDEDLAEATKLNLSFTPSIFVNGTLIEDWTELGQVVESLLKPAAAIINQPSATSTNE